MKSPASNTTLVFAGSCKPRITAHPQLLRCARGPKRGFTWTRFFTVRSELLMQTRSGDATTGKLQNRKQPLTARLALAESWTERMVIVKDAVGIIGGSGLYTLLSDSEERTVSTPYGDPSGPLTVGRLGDREVVFLPRHGRHHEFPPHRVPYLANLWALHSLGVRQVVAPCAVGGLDHRLSPGDLVIPDQLLDGTSARPSTFYDDGAVHVPFADPYCSRGRATIADLARHEDWTVRDRGTLVVINGPRFSSRAESASYAAGGGTVVNMTGMPEAGLARELALCYTAVALVTDLDAGVAEGESVTQREVFAVFEQSVAKLRGLLLSTAARLSADRTCDCARALDGTPAAGRWD